MQDAGDELHLLLHALRQFLNLLIHPRAEIEALAPLPSATVRLGCGDALQLGQEHELVDQFHLLVESAFFRQIADAVEMRAPERFAENNHLSGVRHGDAHHHADGACLACTVGTEQAEDTALFDRDGQVVYGNELVITLGDVSQFQSVGHRFQKSVPRKLADQRGICKESSYLRFITNARYCRPVISFRTWWKYPIWFLTYSPTWSPSMCLRMAWIRRKTTHRPCRRCR